MFGVFRMGDLKGSRFEVSSTGLRTEGSQVTESKWTESGHSCLGIEVSRLGVFMSGDSSPQDLRFKWTEPGGIEGSKSFWVSILEGSFKSLPSH